MHPCAATGCHYPGSHRVQLYSPVTGRPDPSIQVCAAHRAQAAREGLLSPPAPKPARPGAIDPGRTYGARIEAAAARAAARMLLRPRALDMRREGMAWNQIAASLEIPRGVVLSWADQWQEDGIMRLGHRPARIAFVEVIPRIGERAVLALHRTIEAHPGILQSAILAPFAVGTALHWLSRRGLLLPDRPGLRVLPWRAPTLRPRAAPVAGICRIEGCTHRPAPRYRGLCDGCYRRLGQMGTRDVVAPKITTRSEWRT